MEIGTKVAPKTNSEAMRDEQELTNQSTFSDLQAQYDGACRETLMLEQATEMARTRQLVLGAAVDFLNQPRPPVDGPAPTLR